MLIGKKKLYGTKSKGKKVAKPFLWNNAGQWVISGGKSDPGEANLDAAFREFQEETAVDLKVLAPNARTLHFDYFCCFLGIADPDALAALINQNIVADVVTDDELEIVEWVSIATALQRMQLNLDVPKEAEYMAHKPRDWYVDILGRLDGLLALLP